MATFGRTKIRLDVDRVTKDNVREVIGRALPIHTKNRAECEHLYRVYTGDQDILKRQKRVRPEITNRINANHANEIVSFQTSYLLSEPVVYVCRGLTETGVDKELTDKVAKLNDYLWLNNKHARDKEVGTDAHIYGHALRMGLPNPEQGDDEPPFVIYTLSPINNFVVYSTALGEPKLCSVSYVEHEYPNAVNGGMITSETVYSVYTPTEFLEVHRDYVISKPHMLGMIPVIEYVNNRARLGSFEVVESLLDAINTLHSNRVDGTEQAVQSIMVFLNCDIDEEKFEKLRLSGGVKIKSVDGMNSDIKLLTADLKQADQQVLLDALYEEVLRITGMPSQSDGSTSDSSNNGATIVRNGWYNAEARAKDVEALWRESEGEFRKLILRICREAGALDLKPSQVMDKFTRRNYEDIQTRAQVLTMMLGSNKIAPRLAFTASGMFVDPEEAYRESREYEHKILDEMAKMNAQNNITPVNTGGNTAERTAQKTQTNAERTAQKTQGGNEV